MKKHIVTFLAGIVFLAGLSLLLYPTVSNYWNTKHQTQAIISYSNRIEKMKEKDRKQAIHLAKQYNKSLTTNANRFTPTKQEDTVYNALLNSDDSGIMGYITIPKIQCKLPIYHGVGDSQLQNGVGHLEGSSLPVGGSETHCVLSGHRGLPSAKLFTNLDQLEKKDIFYLHVYGKVLAYEVDQIRVVEPDDYGLLDIEEGKDLCTLVTCTPYGINTKRLLVRGHRVSYRLVDESSIPSEAARVNTLVVASVVGILILSIGYVGMFIWKKRR